VQLWRLWLLQLWHFWLLLHFLLQQLLWQIQGQEHEWLLQVVQQWQLMGEWRPRILEALQQQQQQLHIVQLWGLEAVQQQRREAVQQQWQGSVQQQWQQAVQQWQVMVMQQQWREVVQQQQQVRVGVCVGARAASTSMFVSDSSTSQNCLYMQGGMHGL